ncbi:MAG: hypothetical protein WBE26_19245 [Phycisphaerae bacterium]
MLSQCNRSVPLLFLWAVLLCLVPACRQDDDAAAEDHGADTTQRKRADLLVFPDELRVGDSSVNEFVERMMADCASGDYDKFRLLWSARQDPLPRDEYEQGWQAVLKIRIRALEKVMIAPGTVGELTKDSTAYAILADVSLDPTHRAGKREPHREVVLMVIREHDEWRLAHAPKALRTWIKEQVQLKGTVAHEPEYLPTSPEKPD